MADLRFRLWTLYFRLKGHNTVQAEWRARQALSREATSKRAATAHAERARDPRFKCACGQLLTEGDKRCHACGARQWTPPWLRALGRALGVDQVPERAGTYLLMALTAFGFALQHKMVGGSSPGNLHESMALGASFGPLTLGPQPWRAFTYTLVHGGWMHFAFNIFALMQIGPLIERWFGASRFLFGWVFGAAMGVFGPLLIGVEANAPVIGASGAISGLIGMAMIRGHLTGNAQGIYIRNVMIRWMLYTTIFGIAVSGVGLNVAHGAHFGGLLGGVLVGWLLAPAGRSPRRRRLTPLIAALALLGIIAPCVGYGAWLAQGRPPGITRGWLGAELFHEYTQRVGREAALTEEGWALVQSGHARDLAERLMALPESHRLQALIGLAERASPLDSFLIEDVTLALLKAGRIIPHEAGLRALERLLNRHRGVHDDGPSSHVTP